MLSRRSLFGLLFASPAALAVASKAKATPDPNINRWGEHLNKTFGAMDDACSGFNPTKIQWSSSSHVRFRRGDRVTIGEWECRVC